MTVKCLSIQFEPEIDLSLIALTLSMTQHNTKEQASYFAFLSKILQRPRGFLLGDLEKLDLPATYRIVQSISVQTSSTVC